MDGGLPAELEQVQAEAECLHTFAQVHASLDRLARAVTADVGALNPLLIGVMTGAVVTLGLLLPKLPFPLQLDYLQISRYRNQTQGGELIWQAKPRQSLRGRHLLMVDDILDQGETLAETKRFALAEGAASVRLLVLVQKQLPVPAVVTADYVGLTVPDRYVFGCGMDYRGYLRNAPGIFAVREGGCTG
ncbi:MAG: hypoxanthine-guanine phosphoribosyltransferase [Gammaproteobacteria bacterium]|nr:hypoxanthine-guanine phosphoribosyltransferase [Gammaproteobacteria bacterium]